MAKKFPANRIKAHRIYTLWEISDVLGCHKQTVTRWVRDHGLTADTSSKPWLIQGRDLKAFLGLRQTKASCKLALQHCYCLGCKEPREPDGKIADYAQRSPDSGLLTALCPVCCNLMHKIVRRADLEAIRAKIEVTIQQANPRIMSCSDPRSNVTFTEECKPHGKAQQQ